MGRSSGAGTAAGSNTSIGSAARRDGRALPFPAARTRSPAPVRATGDSASQPGRGDRSSCRSARVGVAGRRRSVLPVRPGDSTARRRRTAGIPRHVADLDQEVPAPRRALRRLPVERQSLHEFSRVAPLIGLADDPGARASRVGYPAHGARGQALISKVYWPRTSALDWARLTGAGRPRSGSVEPFTTCWARREVPTRVGRRSRASRGAKTEPRRACRSDRRSCLDGSTQALHRSRSINTWGQLVEQIQQVSGLEEGSQAGDDARDTQRYREAGGLYRRVLELNPKLAAITSRQATCTRKCARSTRPSRITPRPSP